MDKNRKMLTSIFNSEGMYSIFFYSILPAILFGVSSFFIVENMKLLSALIIAFCTYLVCIVFYLPTLIKNIKTYQLEKKIYEQGKNLTIIDKSFSINDLRKTGLPSYGEAMYLYSFKVTYIDTDGIQKEMYSEPYGIKEINYVLNFFSTQAEIDQVLSKLQFELKEFEGKKQLYISTTKENIEEFKSLQNQYRNRESSFIPERKLSMNSDINNYIVGSLNTFFEKKNIKITLNQNLNIENAVCFELYTGYNYNLRDKYSNEKLVNSIEDETDDQSMIKYLFETMSNDVRKDLDVAIYISNYSKLFKTYGLTFNVYCKID